MSKEIRKKLDDLSKSLRRTRGDVIRILIEDYWKIKEDEK